MTVTSKEKSNNYQVNQKQVNVKRGNKSQKLKETARSTKISLFERISIEKI